MRPAVGELLARTGPRATRQAARQFHRGVLRGELLQLSRAFPWPLPESSECGSYWDQLRTWQRVRDEVICPGCGECTALVLDREPMGGGAHHRYDPHSLDSVLLPSAITFEVECQGCGGKSRCGFDWHSCALFFVRSRVPLGDFFDPPSASCYAEQIGIDPAPDFRRGGKR